MHRVPADWVNTPGDCTASLGDFVEQFRDGDLGAEGKEGKEGNEGNEEP